MRCGWDCGRFHERPDAAAVLVRPADGVHWGTEQLCLACVCGDKAHHAYGPLPGCCRPWTQGALVVRGAECSLQDTRPTLF